MDQIAADDVLALSAQIKIPVERPRSSLNEAHNRHRKTVEVIDGCIQRAEDRKTRKQSGIAELKYHLAFLRAFVFIDEGFDRLAVQVDQVEKKTDEIMTLLN